MLKLVREKMEKSKSSNKIEYQNLTDTVYNVLRDRILTHQLKPGLKIVEEKLAQEMGISRTPLKRALTKLEKEHLIETIPRKGTYIRKFSAKDVKEIYEIRKLIEGYSAELAANSITSSELKQMRKLAEDYRKFASKDNRAACTDTDVQFHEILVKANRNTELLEMMKNFNLQIKSMRMNQTNFCEWGEKTTKEHLAIVDALSKGDGKLAKKLAEEHIDNAQRKLLNYLKKS